MKSDAYWSNRFEILNEAQLKKGESYIDSLGREYGKAVGTIQKEIEAFYHRFAANNEISLADTRQTLTAAQLKQFKMSVGEYMQKAKEGASDPRWIKQLENAGKKAGISRLEALQLQISHEVEQLYAKKQKEIYRLLHRIYEDNYYRSIFELQKGTGKGASITKLDSEQINEDLSKPWAPDGKNFKDRILEDKNKLIAELKTTLVQGFVRGDPSDKVISALMERVKVAKSSSSRLILTEAAYFCGQSRIKAYQEMGVEKFRYVSKLDNRTSSKCRQMDGQVIPIVEAEAGVNYPPLHAHCRSTTVPYYEDVEQGPPRNDEIKADNIAAEMTFEQWEKENVLSAKSRFENDLSSDKIDSARQTSVRRDERMDNVASYPPRTPETTAEAQNVVGELNSILVDGKRAPNPVVSVITHEDGTVSVGISGKASPKNIETARQLQNALNKKYGDKYTVKAEPMSTENLYTIGGSNTAGTCAESKVVNAAHDNPSKITGMDTVWRSSKKENPYPYAENSNQMNPCLTCSDIKNIEEYMKYANANKK